MPHFAIVSTLLTVAVFAASADFPLIANNATEYAIAVAPDAIPAETTAAHELQTFLAAACGVQLPIVAEQDAGAKCIVVGPGALFKAAFPEVDLAALGADGIAVLTKDDRLYLAGGRPRGTLYAVYTFLEEQVGFRWWSATEMYTPSRPDLAIPELHTLYTPALRYREAFYRGAFDGVFSARCKCNGAHNGVPEEYGGHYSILGWCHTFYQFLPPAAYFAEHPEWYSELDGKRVSEGAQLCLTNEDMRKEFIRLVLERLRAQPNAGIISVSQNDCGGPCQCVACKALETEEGAPSGPLIHFVNAVAEAVEAEFPDALVETLAYQYTRKAPLHVTPRDNVIIRLCSIECSFSQPLETGPQNAAFQADMNAWSPIAKQLFIWNYVTNFANYLLPHPNMRALAPDIRYFVKNHTTGLFEQGDSGCSCSDFPELRAWLLAHLMWNPDTDEAALTAEFMRGYYGPASDFLQAYIALIHEAVERTDVYLRCYMGDTSSWFGAEGLCAAKALFDQAEAAVRDDAALLARVRRARMPLDHEWLERGASLRWLAYAQGQPWDGPKDLPALCAQFLDHAKAFNAGSCREGAPFDELAAKLRRKYLTPVTPLPECAGLCENGWMEARSDEFSLYSLDECVELIEDPAASDGHAARMTTNHQQWAVQWPIPGDAFGFGTARCLVSVRCEAKAAEGPAFNLGVYDSEAKAPVVQKTMDIKAMAGEAYRTVDLGAIDLKPGRYFWAAPLNNPDAVTAIYVDRVALIFTK